MKSMQPSLVLAAVSGRVPDHLLSPERRTVVSSLRAEHSFGDVVLTMLVGVGLITYQLCRKHRLLRPHPFSV